MLAAPKSTHSYPARQRHGDAFLGSREDPYRHAVDATANTIHLLQQARVTRRGKEGTNNQP